MKKLLGILALGGVLLVAPYGVRAADTGTAASDIHVGKAWMRILPGDLPAGGYAVIRNDGDTAHDITRARSKAYEKVMLHRSTNEGGMSHMQMLHELTIPAHGETTLAPGGYHLMMMHPVHPVKPGDTVTVTLQFNDGSTLDVDFAARPANSTQPD